MPFPKYAFFRKCGYVLDYNSGYDKYISIIFFKGLQKEIPQTLKEPEF